MIRLKSIFFYLSHIVRSCEENSGLLLATETAEVVTQHGEFGLLTAGVHQQIDGSARSLKRSIAMSFCLILITSNAEPN